MFASTLTVGFRLSIKHNPPVDVLLLILTRFSVYVPAIHTVYTRKDRQRNTAWIHNARQNCRLNTNVSVNCIYNQVTLTRANKF
jgi:hypothetical protein